MLDEKPPLEKHEEAEPGTHEAGETTAPAKSGLPPAVALAFVIIALLGVLIATVLRNGTRVGSPGSGPDIPALQAEVNARASELNRQRVAIGLSPLENGGEPIDKIAGRLKKDADSLVALAARFQEMIAEKDTELNAKGAELIRSQKLRQALAAESARLQSELQRALVSSSDADRLRDELAGLKSQREALSSELSELRQKMKTLSAGVSDADYADLKRRLDETTRARDFYEAKVKELQGDLKQAKLFATPEQDLLPAAVELFRSLRKLENKPDSELTTSYSNFGVDLGATVMETVSFATGKSDLSPETQERIRRMVDEMPDGDLLFVAGYASRTGNPESNQTLSSDRATAVAEFYAGIRASERPRELAACAVVSVPSSVRLLYNCGRNWFVSVLIVLLR